MLYSMCKIENNMKMRYNWQPFTFNFPDSNTDFVCVYMFLIVEAYYRNILRSANSEDNVAFLLISQTLLLPSSTFCSFLSQKIPEEFNVFNLIQEMRTQRHSAVQTKVITAFNTTFHNKLWCAIF